MDHWRYYIITMFRLNYKTFYFVLNHMYLDAFNTFIVFVQSFQSIRRLH
jgi:hypothetical protein